MTAFSAAGAAVLMGGKSEDAPRGGASRILITGIGRPWAGNAPRNEPAAHAETHATGALALSSGSLATNGFAVPAKLGSRICATTVPMRSHSS